MKISFLGTGTSGGIPVINCGCQVCLSDDPCNKRLRPSIKIEVDGQYLLIDTSMDLRQQLLRDPMPRIDAVLYTHAHADHIYGMDDLRRFNHLQHQPIPVYGSSSTIHRLRQAFGYAFDLPAFQNGVPNLISNIVDKPFRVNGTEIIPIPLWHGKMEILGYRIGNFAYCTDVSAIPQSSYALLQNLEVLVLDALREEPHPTHFSLSQAIREAQKIGAGQTWFTHMNHKIDHQRHSALLPERCALAWDGLILKIENKK